MMYSFYHICSSSLCLRNQQLPLFIYLFISLPLSLSTVYLTLLISLDSSQLDIIYKGNISSCFQSQMSWIFLEFLTNIEFPYFPLSLFPYNHLFCFVYPSSLMNSLLTANGCLCCSSAVTSPVPQIISSIISSSSLFPLLPLSFVDITSSPLPSFASWSAVCFYDGPGCSMLLPQCEYKWMGSGRAGVLTNLSSYAQICIISLSWAVKFSLLFHYEWF